jgi:uncharacterized protein YceK
MKRILLSSTLAVAVTMCSGCATMLTRDGGFPWMERHKRTAVYPAVCANGRFAVSPAVRDPEKWPGVLLTTPLACVDLPFSVLFDTILLPTDIAEWCHSHR